ncbi:hypothetical protein F5876DRAFT_65517 [Lentinula aff. lateritia]|uniref:Uncharacterized protein n=1 Tax=Lentinula aff. lateritia TaxID=2804960 RepID=A0ACC1U0M2_9AGAR|nr:hypothetical protein F5876DRAFT_65517 [Lentinula aff. lateritia]
MLFLLAWLPFFLYSVVQTVSSARVIGPTTSGPTATVSEKITATWSLDSGDSTLSQGFSMVLVNDAAGKAIEWSTTVNPSGKSIGAIHPIPTATGSPVESNEPINASDSTSSSSFGVALKNNSDSDSGSDTDSSSSKEGESSSSSSLTSITTSQQTSSDTHSTASPSSTSSTPTISSTGRSVSLMMNVTSSTPNVRATSTPTSTSTRPNPEGLSDSDIGIILSAVFGTIILMLLLLAIFLILRRRRRLRRSRPENQTQTRPWYQSERFRWGPPLRGSEGSRGDSPELYETSKTAPMSILNNPESWDVSTIAPSDSVSRFVSLNKGRKLYGRARERGRGREWVNRQSRLHIPAGSVDFRKNSRDRSDDNSRDSTRKNDLQWRDEGSDVGTSVVEATNWVHAGGPQLIPQIRSNGAEGGRPQ